jgi:hypothetical protein
MLHKALLLDTYMLEKRMVRSVQYYDRTIELFLLQSFMIFALHKNYGVQMIGRGWVTCEARGSREREK